MLLPPVLILICGLPGVGKTTLAKELEKTRNAVRFCPDDWIQSIISYPLDFDERDRLRDPVENLQWDYAKKLLAIGVSVILENGFWAEDERGQYAAEALELGAQIELVVLTANNIDALWQRIEQRNQSLESPLWVMTRADLAASWNHFQNPSDWELSQYDAFSRIEIGSEV